MHSLIYLEGMNKQLTNSYMKVQQGKQALLLTWVVQFYLGLDKIHRPWRQSNGIKMLGLGYFRVHISCILFAP